MTALPLPLPKPPSDTHPAVPYAEEPVALLQLDASDPIEAASAVYREVRRGRRVVAVACGGAVVGGRGGGPAVLVRARRWDDGGRDAAVQQLGGGVKGVGERESGLKTSSSFGGDPLPPPPSSVSKPQGTTKTTPNTTSLSPGGTNKNTNPCFFWRPESFFSIIATGG